MGSELVQAHIEDLLDGLQHTTVFNAGAKRKKALKKFADFYFGDGNVQLSPAQVKQVLVGESDAGSSRMVLANRRRDGLVQLCGLVRRRKEQGQPVFTQTASLALELIDQITNTQTLLPSATLFRDAFASLPLDLLRQMRLDQHALLQRSRRAAFHLAHCILRFHRRLSAQNHSRKAIDIGDLFLNDEAHDLYIEWEVDDDPEDEQAPESAPDDWGGVNLDGASDEEDGADDLHKNVAEALLSPQSPTSGSPSVSSPLDMEPDSATTAGDTALASLSNTEARLSDPLRIKSLDLRALDAAPHRRSIAVLRAGGNSAASSAGQSHPRRGTSGLDAPAAQKPPPSVSVRTPTLSSPPRPTVDGASPSTESNAKPIVRRASAASPPTPPSPSSASASEKSSRRSRLLAIVKGRRRGHRTDRMAGFGSASGSSTTNAEAVEFRHTSNDPAVTAPTPQVVLPRTADAPAVDVSDIALQAQGNAQALDGSHPSMAPQRSREEDAQILERIYTSAAARTRRSDSQGSSGSGSPTTFTGPKSGFNPQQHTLSILPTSDNFDASLFVWRVHADTPLRDLVSGLRNMEAENEDQIGKRRALVHENFNEFVHCRATIGYIQTLMQQESQPAPKPTSSTPAKAPRNRRAAAAAAAAAKPTSRTKCVELALDAARTTTDEHFTPLFQKRKRIRKLRRAADMLKRLEYLWQLPQQLRALMEQRRWIEAVIDFCNVGQHLVLLDQPSQKPGQKARGSFYRDAIVDLEACGVMLCEGLFERLKGPIALHDPKALAAQTNNALEAASGSDKYGNIFCTEALSLLLELRDHVPRSSRLFKMLDSDGDPFVVLPIHQAHHAETLLAAIGTPKSSEPKLDAADRASRLALEYLGVWQDARTCLDPSSASAGKEHIFDVLNRIKGDSALLNPRQQLKSKLSDLDLLPASSRHSVSVDTVDGHASDDEHDRGAEHQRSSHAISEASNPKDGELHDQDGDQHDRLNDGDDSADGEEGDDDDDESRSPFTSRLRRTGSVDLLFDIRKRAAANCSLEDLAERRKASDGMAFTIVKAYWATLQRLVNAALAENDMPTAIAVVRRGFVAAKKMHLRGAWNAALHAHSRTLRGIHDEIAKNSAGSPVGTNKPSTFEKKKQSPSADTDKNPRRAESPTTPTLEDLYARRDKVESDDPRLAAEWLASKVCTARMDQVTDQLQACVQAINTNHLATERLRQDVLLALATPRELPQLGFISDFQTAFQQAFADIKSVLRSSSALVIWRKGYLLDRAVEHSKAVSKSVRILCEWFALVSKVAGTADSAPVLFADCQFCRTTLIDSIQLQLKGATDPKFTLVTRNSNETLADQLKRRLQKLEDILLKQYVHQRGMGLQAVVQEALAFEGNVRLWPSPPSSVRPYVLEILLHFANVVAQCAQRVGTEGSRQLICGLTRRLAGFFASALNADQEAIVSSPGAAQQLRLEVTFLRKVLSPYEIDKTTAAFEAILQVLPANDVGDDTQFGALIDEMIQSHQVVAAITPNLALPHGHGHQAVV